MDNFIMDRNSSTAQPPPEDIIEQIHSISMENDNINRDRNSSNNLYNNSNRCLEPVARMIIPRQSMDVNPFATPRNFEALKSERERLESFSQPPGWPIPFIRPESCASAGFFFLCDGDKVQCAFCRGVAGEWEQGDNPMAEHKRHFPRCPFICGLPVGNIPLGDEAATASGAMSGSDEEAAGNGVDVCGPYNPPDLSHLNFVADQPSTSVRGAQPLGVNGNAVVTSLGIKTCGNGPAHTNLVTVPSRIKTFTNWPMETGQRPETMAEAGFFYIGRKDHVKCFYCDGGLRNWEASDDPWLEHARWFSNCTYVILNKGDGFVREVNRVKPPVLPKNQHQYLKQQALTNGNPPRRVSDQELRELIDTPIVQAALEMGMELGKVKSALQRKIQQTGQPFLTTEALLEAVLGRDSEYESDSDSETDHNDDEENLSPAPRPSCPRPNNTSSSLIMASINDTGAGSSTDPSSSSSSSSSSASSEHSNSSGDEETMTSLPMTINYPSKAMSTTSCGSGDSGTGSVSPERVSVSSDDDEHGEDAAASLSCFAEKDNDLEEEVRKLREQTLCKICMDNQVGIVFLPCGHLVSCTRCATAISTCALCRQPIKAMVRTYLS